MLQEKILAVPPLKEEVRIAYDRIASVDETNKRNEVDNENKDVRGEINDNEEDEKEKNTSENDIGMSTNQRVEDINRTQKVITNEKL